MKKVMGLCLSVAFCLWGVSLCFAGTGESFTKMCSVDDAVSGSALVVSGEADCERRGDAVSEGDAFVSGINDSGESFRKETAQMSDGVSEETRRTESFDSKSEAHCDAMSEKYVFTAATSADILQSVLSGTEDECPDYYDFDGNGVVTAYDAAYVLQAVLGC